MLDSISFTFTATAFGSELQPDQPNFSGLPRYIISAINSYFTNPEYTPQKWLEDVNDRLGMSAGEYIKQHGWQGEKDIAYMLRQAYYGIFDDKKLETQPTP